jgi:hypothetical protein
VLEEDAQIKTRSDGKVGSWGLYIEDETRAKRWGWLGRDEYDRQILVDPEEPIAQNEFCANEGHGKPKTQKSKTRSKSKCALRRVKLKNPRLAHNSKFETNSSLIIALSI